MATNEMRREAAKRKLERQQQRRAEQAKKRQRTVVATVVGVVVLVAVLIVVIVNLPKGSSEPSIDAAASPSAAAAPTSAAATPAKALGDCTFTPTPSEPAAKPAPVPPSGPAPTTGTVAVAMTTSAGPIPITLDRTQGPCAVESFLSLAKAGYFDNTPCHRLTTQGIKVLQCGDPTGKGTGGPGYTINDEPPTKLVADATGSATYPRGTLAMAKTSQPDSGGSQFFLVYGDSPLPPDYTVFGTVDAAGLATLDKVAAAGEDDSNGAGDGKPKTPVTITSVKAA